MRNFRLLTRLALLLLMAMGVMLTTPASGEIIPSAVTAQVDSASTLPTLNTGTVYAPELKIPSNALNQFEEGKKDYNASRYEEAAEHFKLAGRLHPKYSLAYSALAMSLLRLRRFDESHRALEVAISLNRNSPYAVLTLGVLYFYESKFSESEIQLQRLVAVLPHEPNARLVLSAIAMFRSDYNDVIKQTDAIEEKDAARYPSAFLLRGEAFEKLGFVHEAVACYERYLHSHRKGRINLEVARSAIARLNASADKQRTEPAN